MTNDKRIPRSYGTPTEKMLSDPRIAIEYIAAAQDEHARNYEKYGMDIRSNAPVLATLYQTGNSHLKAPALAKIRARERLEGKSEQELSQPQASERAMGSFVRDNADYIDNLLDSQVNIRKLLDIYNTQAYNFDSSEESLNTDENTSASSKSFLSNTDSMFISSDQQIDNNNLSDVTNTKIAESLNILNQIKSSMEQPEINKVNFPIENDKQKNPTSQAER
jgi:Protein of unknown function (DUF1402)